MLQAVYSLASGSHLYSGSQTVDYVANLTHNASVLICQVTAANHWALEAGAHITLSFLSTKHTAVCVKRVQ